MACRLHVAWDDRLTGYDFGPSHPPAPVRAELTVELARGLGRAQRAGGHGGPPRPGQRRGAGADPRSPLHCRRPAGRRPARRQPARPVRPGHAGQPRCSASIARGVGTVARATLAAARPCSSRAARASAGIRRQRLHHAMAASASGFCVYNDLAIAIAWLLAEESRAGSAYVARTSSTTFPRRRGTGRVLRRPAGADDQPARDAGAAVPRHRTAVRDRRPNKRGQLRW